MRFISDDDDVRPVGELGVRLAIVSAELLNKREQVAVVFGIEKLLQMVGTLRPDVLFLLNHRAGRGEVLVDLSVEVFAVGDDEERPVAVELPMNLLREEDHREALA